VRHPWQTKRSAEGVPLCKVLRAPAEEVMTGSVSYRSYYTTECMK